MAAKIEPKFRKLLFELIVIFTIFFGVIYKIYYRNTEL